ncbi:MAG TPA: hypothetical protein PLJ78_01680 [Anaerolineae bacterium]|nr:hypothetical protein [Anaerolineae bacterium]HQK12633.1 hypothetical protein [Anaerolineae bacterium]
MKTGLNFLRLMGTLALLALSAGYGSRITLLAAPVTPASTAPDAIFNWELIVHEAVIRVLRSPNYATDHALYIVTDQAVRRSTDDGDTWTTIFATTPYSESLHISALAVAPGAASMPTLFVTRNVGYDHGEVFRSTDDGLTWESVLAPSGTLFYDVAAARAADGNLVVFAVGFSPDVPSVWRSTDGGDTWVLANTGLQDYTNFYRIYPSPNFVADHTVYITGYGPPLRSTDGGQTWQTLRIQWVDIAREIVFSPNYVTDGTLWMSYFFVEGSGEGDIPPNGVVRSTDFGVTWQKVNTGLHVDYLDGWILGLAVSPDYPADRSLYAIQRTLQYDATPWMFYRSPNGSDRWWMQGRAPDPTPQGLLVASRNLFFLPTIEGLYRLRNDAWEWIVNGNAELDEGWSFPITPATAIYTTTQAHGGARSIRLGIVGTANTYAYSSARQRVTLPATATSAQLSVWLYPVSTEKRQATFSSEMATALSGAMPAAPAAGDAQYILIMDDNEKILQRLLWTLDNSRMWKAYTFDLSAYIGRSIWVHFGVYNDGSGGITGMYVDDVSLTAREPVSPPVSPPANPGAIGEDFLLTDAGSYQSTPAVAFNPEDNEFLLAYRDSRVHSLPDIYIQRVSSDGRLLGNAVAVTSDDTIQDYARVAYLPAADRYLVVWQDSRNITDTPDVYGQLVRRDGTLDGDIFPIAVYSGGQVTPRVAAGANAFLVVWGNADATTSRVQGQLVGGDGALLGSRFDISDGVGWAGQADVAYRPAADRYLVVWADVRVIGSQNIYAQHVLPDGTLDGGNIPVTEAPRSQEWPAVAAGGADDAALVVWEDWRDDQRDIYGQYLKSDNTFAGSDDILIGTNFEHEEMPTLAVWETAGNSVFFVIWEIRTGRGDVIGQRVAGNGQLIGGTFIVNDEPHTQSRPAIAVGRTAPQPVVLAVWEDYRSGPAGIYGQRLNGDALKVGLPIGLTPLDGLQARPVIAYSATSDRYLAAWYHFDPGGARIMAYTYYYSTIGDGTLFWRPFTVTANIQTPDLAMDAAWDAVNDRFLVVWSDIQPGSVDDFDIFGQLLTNEGEPLGEQFVVSSASGPQCTPKVAFSRELERYLVVFESTDTLSQTTNLYGQFLDTAGAPLLTNVDENFVITMPGEQHAARDPDVAYDAASRSFLAVWQDNRLDARWDIYGRRVAGDTGTLLPMEYPIAATDHFEQAPRLAAGPAGHYLVVWQDTSPGADGAPDVLGRMINASGQPQGTPISIAATAGYYEGAPDVAYNTQSWSFLVAWHGAPQGGAGFAPDIYARQLHSNGSPTMDVLPITVDADSSRRWPVIVSREGRREWLLAWEDGRADPAGAARTGVYARHQLAVVWYIHLPLVMRKY